MTDDRIDYHRNRLRGVPLADLGRIAGEVLRDVVREAQAEQSAQIERMRAALLQARTVVAVDRASFVQCATAPHLPLDPDDQGIVDEYDALLRMIDEAIGEMEC